jgi:hypothetical protein
VGIIGKIKQGFKEVAECEKFVADQRKRQAELTQYWDNYWECALVLWEIVTTNQTLLKVHTQKEPKFLKPTPYTNKNTNKYEFVLYRLPNNTPQSDGAVLRHEVSRIIKQYLSSCNFIGIDVDCEETVYTYIVTISIPGLAMGRPMSSKIGRLSVRRYYDVFNDLNYNAFTIKYFDSSSFVEIKDNASILLYNEGQFLQSTTRRDAYGNISLSRLPFNPNFSSGYLIIV